MVVGKKGYEDLALNCLLLSSADNLCKQLDPDHARHYVEPDLTCGIPEMVDFVKNQQTNKKACKITH